MALVREHGAKAGTVAKTHLEKAKASGKKKLTKAAAMSQFSAKRACRLVELLCDAHNGEASENGKLRLYIKLAKYRQSSLNIPRAYRTTEPVLQRPLQSRKGTMTRTCR